LVTLGFNGWFQWVFRSSIEGDILCSTFTKGIKT
jgi:hypothetical protein